MNLKKYIKDFLKENIEAEVGTGEFDYLHNSPKAEFEVINYDVWGNEDEGFEVNNAFKTGKFITLYENMTDDEIIERLKEKDFVHDWVTIDSVEISGEFDHSLQVTAKENGKPLFELQNSTTNG
jgi:hypothetical protein